MPIRLPTPDNPTNFPTPEEIKLALDYECIGNDHYKYSLANVFIEHLMRNSLQFASVEAFPRTNLLVTGPTGSGKSHLLKCLSNIVGSAVPIIYIDCSLLTPSGYKGVNLEDLIINNWPTTTKTRRIRKYPDTTHDLTTMAIHETVLLAVDDYDAYAPLIFVDEIDKISMKLQHDMMWGLSRQISLLKLLEGGHVSSDSKQGGPSTVHTSRATVVLAGCFDSVAKYNNIDSGLGASIGFSAVPSNKNKDPQITRESLMEYGFMPELAGRVSDVISLQKIPKDMYLQLLCQPDTGIFEKYKRLFLVYNVYLRLTGKTATEIVDKAYSSKLGVRSLSTELHIALKPYMKDLKQYPAYTGYTLDV